MMKYKRIIIVLTVSFVLLVISSLNAVEPERPDINVVFDPNKETKINEVARLPVKEAFKKLKEVDFYINEDLLHKAIYKAFKHRKKEAIDLAMNSLRLPEREIINGEMVRRTDDLYISKKILQVFPDESVNGLLSLYKEGNTITKGNIICALGKIAGGQPIKELLIKALNDKTFIGEEDPEIEGEPLRICDLAYNQLVLRYKIKNVLRTIGTSYRIEVRDYHINILKSIL